LLPLPVTFTKLNAAINPLFRMAAKVFAAPAGYCGAYAEIIGQP